MDHSRAWIYFFALYVALVFGGSELVCGELGFVADIDFGCGIDHGSHLFGQEFTASVTSEWIIGIEADDEDYGYLDVIDEHEKYQGNNP